jgi:cell division septation protein DedD
MGARGWPAILLCAPLLWAAPAPAQNVKAGIEAWQQADYARAVAIWRSLAESGDADAAFNLGQAYRLGRGVKIDLGAAQTWLERAAVQGHVDAQTTLGLLLFGNGNQVEGARWLKQAAEKGEARAMLVYGTALFNGDGVPQDRILGYAYVSRASAQGLGPAKATLSQMDEVMPLAERKKGLAIAMQKAKAQGKASAKKSEPQTAKAPKVPAPKPAVTTSASGWAVQLGAFSKRSSAEALYRKLSSAPVLAGKQPLYVAAGSVTRLQVGGFGSRSAASAACASLAKSGQACFPVSSR